VGCLALVEHLELAAPLELVGHLEPAAGHLELVRRLELVRLESHVLIQQKNLFAHRDPLSGEF
jgi:hypothetical protein